MKRRRELLPLLIITAFAAAVRFAFLDQQSFWFDEAITVEFVRKSFLGMLGALPNGESTPPLYYVLAWAWSRIFGTGEIGLRSLSAALGTATVPVAFALGRLFASRRAGLFAASLAACSPLLVWYSQEARSYALLAFLSAVSVLAFEHSRRRPSGRALTTWAISAALALATHYFAVFLVAGEGAWLLVVHARRRAALVAVAAVAGVAVALAPLALHQGKVVATGWISAQPVSGRVREAVTQFVSGVYGPPHHASSLLAALTVVGVGGLAWFVDERCRRAAAIPVLLGAFAVLAPLALAWTSWDKFLYRNLIGAWVPLAVGVAIILSAPRTRRIGLVVTASACAVELTALAIILHRPALQRDDWRSATHALQSSGRPEAIITRPGFDQHVIRLYRPDVRPLPPRGARVSDLVFLGPGRFPLDFRPPPGFKRIEQRRIQHIALLRYRASQPQAVTPAAFTAQGFSKEGVLWEPVEPR